jgi:2-polyprenyl-3-methyl-5-hydroxy-6-metoxy-1,4-benzoquinol methylase
VSPKDKQSKSGEGTNRNLLGFYEEAYRTGAANVFSNWEATEADTAVAEAFDWTGLHVLDIGCGTGRCARKLRDAGAAGVVAVDYSKEAIRLATSETSDRGIEFICSDFLDFTPAATFDGIVTLGTLEHMDDPIAFLRHAARHMKPNGKLVVTCPHFMNLRGIVWMTLSKLFDIPMSLSDLHFIHPWDMESWCGEASLKVVSTSSLDAARGNGDRLIVDFEKRLPNALRDAGLPTDRVSDMMEYLINYTSHITDNKEYNEFEGATALYVIEHDGTR